MSQDALYLREIIHLLETGSNVPFSVTACMPDLDVDKFGHARACLVSAVNDDMNASLSLLSALLPGWEWGREGLRTPPRMWVENIITGRHHSARGKYPARVLTLAILRAYQAEYKLGPGSAE